MSEDRPNIIAHPPLIVGGMMAAGYIVGEVMGASLPRSFSPFGWLLVILGGLSGVLGVWQFKTHGTNVIPHKPALRLVTDGIYRLTRNPMYVGLLAIHAGLAFIFTNAGMLIFWPASALMLHFGVVVPEETYLTQKFGKDYSDYLTNSRRWLW